MRWILSNEKRPDKEDVYFTRDTIGSMSTTYYSGSSWHSDTGHPVKEWLDESESPSPSHNDIVQEMEEELINAKENLKKGDHNNYWLAIKETLEEYIPKLKQIGEGSESGKAYQWRVHDWMLACFGEEISSDVTERNHRFIEEALELVQVTGATKSECHQLVDYVFNRPIGEVNQEIGGVMVTLAALCNALGLNMNKAGETELERIWTKVEKIRAKQAAKPKHSPLPQSTDEGSESYWKKRCEAAESYLNARDELTDEYERGKYKKLNNLYADWQELKAQQL